MDTVLWNLLALVLIALSIAVPLWLFVRFTRPDEPAGNRFLGLLIQGLGRRGRDRKD